MDILFNNTVNIMTNSYKILIGDRNYTEWNLYDASHLNEVDKINMNPYSNVSPENNLFEDGFMFILSTSFK